MSECNYNNYGQVAVKAAQAKGNPKDAWSQEVKEVFFILKALKRKVVRKMLF